MVGEFSNDQLMTTLRDHEKLFLEMTKTLSAISEKLTNYPSIVDQTALNMQLIAAQTKRCSELQDAKQKKKLTREQMIREIIIGVVVGVVVCIGTIIITKIL